MSDPARTETAAMREADHVVLGALLHDVGKFLERGGLMGELRDDPQRRARDCPFIRRGEGGYHGMLHVLHTRRFCEWLVEPERFAGLKPPGYDPEDQTAQHWINLAARHHKISREFDPAWRARVPLQTLVMAADHLASAEREKGDFYRHKIHLRTRLEPILERVSLAGKPDGPHARLPLNPVTTVAEACFPRAPDGFEPPMAPHAGKNATGLLSPTDLTARYKELGEGFLRAVEKLPRPDPDDPGAVRRFIRALLPQMERFMSAVPAATNVAHPDVSLFDHLRITAAIAEGLYHQDRAGQVVERKYHLLQEPHWRLACGDFSGIQKFIYNVTAKRAARGLRGRSLFISLLSDGIAQHLAEALDLHPSCIVYAAGGRFYLLIPACREAALRERVKEVNRHLIDVFQGRVFLGLGLASVEGRHFQEGRMGSRWKETAEALARDRLQPFGALMGAADFSLFDPVAVDPDGHKCDVCGRDDAAANLAEETPHRREEPEPDGPRRLCAQCRDLEKLGQGLADARFLLWRAGDGEASRRRLREKSGGREIVLLGGARPLAVYPMRELESFRDLLEGETALADPEACHLERINLPVDPPIPGWAGSSGFRFIAKWAREKEEQVLPDLGRPWEFSDFSDTAIGLRRMGVLRMDVDDLGEIFMRGLRYLNAPPPQPGDKSRRPRYRRELGSLSRMATLSRQLHWFFAGHLQTALADLTRCQLIYAGGDDLFLVGAWDELPEAARLTRDAFERFSAHNRTFTLSGGVAMVGGRYPISRAAELAGAAEERAKAHQRPDGRAKDAFCLLETVVGWEDFSQVEAMRQTIRYLAENDSKGIIDRLRQVVRAVEAYRMKARRLEISRGATPGQLQDLVFHQSWKWRLIYALVRSREKKRPEIVERYRWLQEEIVDPRPRQGGQPVLDWLALPVRWAEFLEREEN